MWTTLGRLESILRILALTVALTLSAVWSAPARAAGEAGPWRTVETEHYRLHYPLAAETWALEQAGRLEVIRARVSEEVGYAPTQVVDIVVMDPYASANGFAIPLIRKPRMAVFPTAPNADSVIGHYRAWGEDLITHEDAHLVHLLRPSRNPAVRWLMQPLLRMGPIPVKAPGWVVEGYATVVEGRLTGQGRPNSDGRALLLRTLAAEGRLPAYEMLDDGGDWPGRGAMYLVGSGFLEWLEERQGPGSLRDLWAALTARTHRDFEESFALVFGESPGVAYARFEAELAHDALLIERSRPGEVDTLFQAMRGGSGAPAVSPDGSQVALVRRVKMGPPELVVWSTEGDSTAADEWTEAADARREKDPDDPEGRAPAVFVREPVALRRHGDLVPWRPRWMPDGNGLLFTAMGSDADGMSVPELYRWDVETGRDHRITYGGDVRSADPSPDGTWAVAVRTRWGDSQLVRVDLESGEVSALTESSHRVVDDLPRVSPDGETVAWLRNEGGWQVALLDVATGQVSRLPTPAESIVSALAWDPDGQSLLLSLGEGGFVEVHRAPLNGDERTVLTTTLGGALSPDPTPDGAEIFYLSMDAEGLDLHRFSLDEHEPMGPFSPGDLAPVTRPLPPQFPPLAEGTAPEPHVYRLGRPELGLLLGGLGSAHGSAWEYGVRVGDVVGRSDLVLLGERGEGDMPSGFAGSWQIRALPVDLAVHGFATQLEPVGGASSSLLMGSAARAMWDRYWRTGAVGLELGGGAGQVAGGDRAAGWLMAGARQRVWMGRGWMEVSGEGSVQAGRRLDSWTRGWGSGGLVLGWGVFGGGVSADMGLASTMEPSEMFSLGGLPVAHLPAGWEDARVSVPGVRAGTMVGAERGRLRAELGLPPDLVVFAQRDTVSACDSVLCGASTRAGLELSGPLAAQPMLRLPSGSLTIGGSCELEGPVTGWHSEPCRSWEEWGFWSGVSWGQ